MRISVPASSPPPTATEPLAVAVDEAGHTHGLGQCQGHVHQGLFESRSRSEGLRHGPPASTSVLHSNASLISGAMSCPRAHLLSAALPMLSFPVDWAGPIPCEPLPSGGCCLPGRHSIRSVSTAARLLLAGLEPLNPGRTLVPGRRPDVVHGARPPSPPSGRAPRPAAPVRAAQRHPAGGELRVVFFLLARPPRRAATGGQAWAAWAIELGDMCQVGSAVMSV